MSVCLDVVQDITARYKCLDVVQDIRAHLVRHILSVAVEQGNIDRGVMVICHTLSAHGGNVHTQCSCVSPFASLVAINDHMAEFHSTIGSTDRYEHIILCIVLTQNFGSKFGSKFG